MRISCPICGGRDLREFEYLGDAVRVGRPDPEAGAEAWDDYLHNRANVAGRVQDLWYHEAGCAAWLVVERDTVSHEIYSVRLAAEVTT